MGPYRHYLFESQTSQLDPSILSNLSPRPLVGIKSRGACRTCCCRSKEARWRRGMGRRGPRHLYAPEGGFGSARACPWPPGHAHRRPRRPRHRRPRATAARRGRGGVRRVEEEEAKLLVHVVGHEGARKLGNGGDSELGCGVHGGGVQERTRVARARGHHGCPDRARGRRGTPPQSLLCLGH